MGDKAKERSEYDHFAPPTPPVRTDYRHARWPRFTEPQPEDKSGLQQPRQAYKVAAPHQHRHKSPDVLVVGVCSSGKSTLVRKLKEAGYNAHSCSQEHSYIPHLWQRSEPRTLVYLDASLGTIRGRRGAHWKQEMIDEQHRRLAHARRHCDLYIQTDALSVEDVAARVLAHLREQSPGSEQGGQLAAG